MKRKFISFMLVLTLVITALSLTGINLTSLALTYNDTLSVEGETEDWYYQTDYSNYNEAGGLEIYWYKGNQKNVVIPSEINGIPVTSVGNLWTDKERHEARPHIYPWYDTSNVESVVVPETVKGLYASFENLTNLKSVTFHEGLEVIGRDTFKNCSRLTEIDIPDSVVTIDIRAFENSGVKNKPEIIYSGGYYDLKGIKGSSEIIFNSPEVEFQNLRHAQVDKIICNGFIKFFEYYNDNLGVMDNKNLEIVCNGGLYEGLHEEYIYERGLYAHLDEETGVITYSSVPVEKGTEYVSGDYRYYLNSDNEAVISRYLGKDSEVSVPETIDGYTVGEIGTMAFAGGGDERYDSVVLDSKQITSVVLPETVKKIGAFAFEWNVSLVSVEMPDAVKVISSNAFERCVSLQNIDWPASLEAIGPMAFYNCDGLTSIHIPEGVTRIGSNAFGNCKNLESVTFPESLTSIGYYAFISDKKLKSVSIPDSVTELGIGAFRYCSALTEANLPANIAAVPDLLFQSTDLKSIDIPETVTKIGIDAFGYTELSEVELPSNLKHIAEAAFYGAKLTELNLPSSVEYVGPYAFGDNNFESLVIDWQNISIIQNATFESCKKLKSVEIKGRIREIRPYAFYGCTALEEIVLSDNVKKIYISAFEDNTALETVTIPEGVDYLGSSVFKGCSNLKTLYFNATECKIGFFDDSYYTIDRQLPFGGCGITELHIGDKVEYLDRFIFASLTSLVNIEFPESVKSIGDYSFAECTALQSVTLPDSVEAVGEYAFSGCTALQSATLPNSVEVIGKYVFKKCTSLVSIEIPDSLTNVSYGMFDNCKSLKSIVLPDTLKTISSFAFDGCESLESIDMPDNLETIGVYAFRDCTSLTEITIPEKTQGLNVNAFKNCTSLKTVYYNAKNCSFTGVTESETEGINYSPFINCTALETVVLNEDMTSIPDSFFCGLKSLLTVDIPAKVTTIGKGAFAYSSLTALTGCEGVRNIKEYAFYKCENLDEFVLPEKVTDINPNTFAYSGLRSFVASDNLESILEKAFFGCFNLQNVDLKNYIMIVEKNAFEGCTSLKNIVVPDSVINIGNRAFADCPALETVYMSVNVDYIPTECFYNDTALSSFTWDAASKLIGRLAFGNCTSLNDFNFIGIEKLYESSFYNSGVKVVSLGEALNDANAKLEEIQAQSFQNCAELEAISIGGNVSTVSSLAFADCPNLEMAVISDSVTEIADDAFDDCPNLTFVCSQNSYAYAYASANGIPVSTLVIAAIPNQTYTGYAIRPAVTVTFSNSPLTKDVDFSVSYSNNTNVGQATVNVKGMGKYDMLASKARFTIVTRSIARATVSEIKPQKYTGEKVEPSLTVTDNGRYLKEGRDYKVYYYNNASRGTAYVSIAGTGNYSGSVQKTFEIKELDNSEVIKNWFLNFIKDFFAQFVSIFLTMGFRIR